MSYANGPKIVTDGLILCIDAGNVKSYLSGSSNWNDLSSFRRVGSLQSGSFYTPTNGGILNFDGVNDHVTFPNAFSISLGFTGSIEFFCKGKGMLLTNYRTSTTPGDGTMGIGWDTVYTDNRFVFHTNSNAGPPYGYFLTSSVLLDSSVFNYCALAVSMPLAAAGTTTQMNARFCINGNFENRTSSLTMTTTTAYTTLDVGRHQNFNYGNSFYRKYCMC